MSDVHIKYLLARVEMSGSAIAVRGDDGPRNTCAVQADVMRSGAVPCRHCGSFRRLECDPRHDICAVREIEMRKAKR